MAGVVGNSICGEPVDGQEENVTTNAEIAEKKRINCAIGAGRRDMGGVGAGDTAIELGRTAGTVAPGPTLTTN